MKKIILLSALFLLLGFASHVVAQTSSGFVPLAPIPGLTQGATADSAGLATFFNNLYKYLIGLAAALAVIMIIWGGLEISTQDSISKQGAGREKITQAILGLILVLSPVLVFSIINPSILNLSLNLEPLKTGTSTSTTGGGPGEPPTTGCAVVGNGSIFQIATCSSLTAAQTWGQGCSTGLLSEIVPITRNSDGTISSARVSCIHSNIFEFVDVHTSALTSSIGRLQPLAVASNSRINGTNTLYQNNGSDAVQFAAICKSIGWKTCISDRPLLTFSHACEPPPTTSLPAAAPSPAKCYKETLGCVDVSFVNNDLCSGDPGWTPFK